MKLFVHPLCPFVQRVIIGIEERGLQALFDFEPISFDNPPAALLAINPAGSVPTLSFGPSDGFNESMVILEFLDSLPSQGPKLFGHNPSSVAKTRVKLERLSNTVISPIQATSYAFGKKDQALAAVPKVAVGFAELNQTLATSDFLGGKQPSALDASLAPFLFMFVDLLKNTTETEPILSTQDLALETYPSLQKYVGAIKKRWAHISPMTSLYSKETSHADYIALKISQFQGSDGSSVVRAASRVVLTEVLISKALEIDATKQKLNNPKSSLKMTKNWTLANSQSGLHIETNFRWDNWELGTKVASAILNFQENCDHHCEFNLQQNNLTIKLCTHEPVWGISPKDLAFASAITSLLSKIA